MPASKKRFWKQPRFWIIGCATVVLFFVFSVFLLTRSFVLSPILAKVIGNQINAQVKIKSAIWSWNGSVILKDLEIHAIGIEGPASRIALFDLTTVQVDNWMPWQSIQIKKINTDHLTIRVAESEVISGEFNFSRFMESKLSMGESSDSSQPKTENIEQQFTLIDLQTLTLEIGTMQETVWTLSDHVDFTVSLDPIDEHSYHLDLSSEDDSIHIKGKCDFWSPEISLTVDPMQLGDSLFVLLPKTARLWCSAIGLRGDVGELGIHWDTSGGFQLAVDVESIEFFLPEAHSLEWVHYEDGIISKMQGNPSLRFDRGRISYNGNSATLENLQGVLLPPQSSTGSSEVPFQVTLQISELPTLQNLDGQEWFDAMKQASPFRATFKIDNFKSKIEGAGQVDLPIAVARILQLFHLKDWDVNGQLIVERSSQSGEIEYKGNVAVNGGSGWYEGFPYPLHDVKALIDVHNDSFVIQSFEALGSEDAAVIILGDITVSNQTAVDLMLLVDSAPLNKSLRDAVPKPVATVMDRLLDQSALDRLISKGLLKRKDFTLGGSVDIKLSISHSGIEGDSVQLSGDLNFKDTNIIHDVFPYPITIDHASLRLEPNKLEIPLDQQIVFRGMHGGSGTIFGDINFDEKGNTQPDLVFGLLDVPITRTMVEAVAVSSGDSYQTVVGVLGGLGLEGSFKAAGGLITDAEGNIEKTIIVTISKSTASPQPKFAKAIHAANAFWPDKFMLTNVSGTVTVTNEGVLVEKVHAEFDEGELFASMNIHGGDFELQVDGTNFPISKKLVYLLPPNASANLARSWQTLEPTGELDAMIRMNHHDGKSYLHLEAIPIKLGVTGNNQTVMMHCVRGGIVVDDSSVYLNDLHFLLDQDGTSQGAVQFDGNIQVVDGRTDYDITARWDDAVASSPLSRAITGIIGGEAAMGYFDSLSPQGEGFVTLETTKRENEGQYRVVIVPENLSATFQNRVAYAQFTDEVVVKKSQIVFDNTGIYFDQLGGKLGNGKFAIDGKIDTQDKVKGTFQLDWEGPADDESLFAVLPSVVGDTLEAMEIGNGTSKVDKGMVSLSGSHWNELEVDFKGDIQLRGVSLNAGILLSDIDGTTVVDGIYDEDRLTSLQLQLQLDKMTVVGRKISNIEGGLILNPLTDKMTFEGVRGNSSSGVVTLSGWVGVDASKEYEVTALLAGVLLEDDDTSNVETEGATFEGELTGWLSIGGVRGESSSRRGIGELQVSHGLFAKIPLSMRALQLLQLTLPTTEAISTVSINLYINGENVVIEQIKLTGDDTSVQGLVISGSGKLEVPSFELDVELHPRAGWPILRDVTGALGDQLFSIKVTGQLLDPTITYVPLPILHQD